MNLGESDIELKPAGCRRRSALRRLRAGELEASAAVEQRAHLDACAACQAVWRELEAEDAEVRRALPLEKLEAKLAQPAKVVPLRRPWGRAAPAIGLALAAGLAALLVAPRVAMRGGDTRSKGGLSLDVFVGGVGEPRRVDAPAVALNPGERVQLKVHGNGHRYVAVLSIDERGAVSPLFFANDASLPLAAPEELLPQSIDFDGDGREKLVVLFSDAPLGRERVEQAAREAFARAGSLDRMGRLSLDGVEELDRTVLKAEGR